MQMGERHRGLLFQQTHPNNVLLHVLASFVGKVHYLLLITDGQDANERHRVLLSSGNPPNNVLLHVIASFAGNVPLFVAYCRI